MTADEKNAEEEKVPEDLFKDVTYYVVGDIDQQVALSGPITPKEERPQSNDSNYPMLF